MTDKEKLVIISDLSFAARNYISDAIMGIIETDEALRVADSLLTAVVYVKNYEVQDER